MLFIKNFGNDPYFNMAMEEYLIDNLTEDVFMLWQNTPSVIVGVHQNALEELDLAYAKSKGIAVVRRLSGGGAVYHDSGNVNYTIIQRYEKGLFANYELFTEAVRGCLESLGVRAALRGKNDLEIDGKKFSGNAQCVRGGRIMHHGTLLFDSDTTELSRVLIPDPMKIESKGVKSVKSRVTNIKPALPEGRRDMTVGDFISGFESYCFDKIEGLKLYEPEAADLARVQELRDEKYATWDWNFGKSPKYSCSYKKRYDFGIVDVRLFVKGGIIENAGIYGDFFGRESIEALEKRLIGIRHSKEDIERAFAGVDPEKYISGMKNEEFLRLITDNLV